jgi:hypothetical protein
MGDQIDWHTQPDLIIGMSSPQMLPHLRQIGPTPQVKNSRKPQKP